MIVNGLENVRGFKVTRPGGAFYVFPNIKEMGMSSFDFAMKLLTEARVAVVHGGGLGQSGEGHVRISFSVSDDTIREALRRITGWVDSLSRT